MGTGYVIGRKSGRNYLTATSDGDDLPTVSVVEEKCERAVDFTDPEEVEAAIHALVGKIGRMEEEGYAFTNSRINSVYDGIRCSEKRSLAALESAKKLCGWLLVIIVGLGLGITWGIILDKHKIDTRLEALESSQPFQTQAATQGDEDG